MASQIKQDAANLLKIIVMSPQGIQFKDLLNQSGLLPEDMKRGLSLLYGPLFIKYESAPGGGPKLYTATQEGITFYNSGAEIPDRPSFSSGDSNYSQDNRKYLWIGASSKWSIEKILVYPASSYTKSAIVHLDDAAKLVPRLADDLTTVISGVQDAYLVQGQFISKEENGMVWIGRPTKVEIVSGVIRGTAPATSGTQYTGHSGATSQQRSSNNLAQAFEQASTDGFDQFFGTSLGVGDDDDLPF